MAERDPAQPMMSGPAVHMLPDGRRLHLSHGPIDLIVQAFGDRAEIAAAYDQAAARFQGILPALVEELDMLRCPLTAPRPAVSGAVARRMVAACWPHRSVFVTPMAAVAGAVADEMLAALVAGRVIEKAYVNNGGDIAFHVVPGASLTAGLVTDYHLPAVDATCVLGANQPVRGIATSGWKGRSFSLGIADSVTVLARTAAEADVAATLIANAVNVADPAIDRAPARSLDPDSDLGDRLVTTAVGPLDPTKVAAALDAGRAAGEEAERTGVIQAAVLVLRGDIRTVGRHPAGLIGIRAA